MPFASGKSVRYFVRVFWLPLAQPFSEKICVLDPIPEGWDRRPNDKKFSGTCYRKSKYFYSAALSTLEELLPESFLSSSKFPKESFLCGEEYKLSTRALSWKTTAKGPQGWEKAFSGCLRRISFQIAWV
jgi:hypothetical protein